MYSPGWMGGSEGIFLYVLAKVVAYSLLYGFSTHLVTTVAIENIADY